MQLGRYNLVKTDLVPLLITYPNDEDLLYNTRERVHPPHVSPRPAPGHDHRPLGGPITS